MQSSLKTPLHPVAQFIPQWRQATKVWVVCIKISFTVLSKMRNVPFMFVYYLLYAFPKTEFYKRCKDLVSYN